METVFAMAVCGVHHEFQVTDQKKYFSPILPEETTLVTEAWTSPAARRLSCLQTDH